MCSSKTKDVKTEASEIWLLRLVTKQRIVQTDWEDSVVWQYNN
jgi:hypothetical protein